MTDGILIINKEPGFTSFDVVAKLRGILHQKKIGHTGTLDPMAEGVLVVCLGKATRLSNMLESEDKRYRALVRLGTATDTEDVTGRVLQVADEPSLAALSEERIRETVLSFVGRYDQIPPMYSAIKKDGKKLYEYARAGIEVEREPRPVEIFEIDNLSVNGLDVSFDVHCSKGTYIRSLARDIGEKLGCFATLAGLTRSDAHGYSLAEALTLDQVQKLADAGEVEACVKPMDEIMSGYDRLIVKPEGEKFLRNGNPLSPELCEGLPEKCKDGTVFRVYFADEFLALYAWESKNHRLKPYKMFL